MRFEHWLIITGPTLVLLVALFALFPDDYWDVEHDAPVAAAPMPPPVVTAPEEAGWLGDMLGAGAQTPPMTDAPVAMKVVAQTPRTAKAQPGITRFEQAPSKRFSGTVQQVTELQQQDGQIHIWVTDASNREVEVSVAPSWFLTYIGCEIPHDITLSGVGFYFNNQGPDPLIYARKIVLNGKTCLLRNDEGFALWSNQLR